MSSKNLTPFAFDDSLVRVHMDENGNPWFVAKDVCRVLELGNVTEATRNLDDDERGSVILNTLGGPQTVNTVSESGLYSLVFRSRKPEAKRFRKWVTSEVLPALRRTGTYAMPSAAPQPPAVPAPEPASPRKHALPDIELPEEALHLRPAVRLRLWQDSLQAARLEGAGMTYAVECFIRLCTVMAKCLRCGNRLSARRSPVSSTNVATRRRAPEPAPTLCIRLSAHGGRAGPKTRCPLKKCSGRQWAAFSPSSNPTACGIAM